MRPNSQRMRALADIAERARAVLAGGCDSPVRSGRSIGEPMFVQSFAQGAYAFDEAGRRYIDYVMGYGPVLFGHTHRELVTGLDELASAGFVWGATHPEEVRLAERVRCHLPSMERMRFVTTGSEAVMSAVRVARAFTQRDLILKFAGNYHGHFDLALLDAGASAHTGDARRGGIPRGVARDVAIASYNDLDSVDALVHGRERDTAAILVEPVCGNMGWVQPVPGFLEGLRERCDRYGTLLIFDEVIAWPRLGLTGAQGRYGVIPDMTTIGKVLGGGAPIAAFGGRADVMAVLAPDGPVFTGGTHAGNPFSIAMANRVLDLLESHPEYYEQLSQLARRLADGLRSLFAKRGLPYAVIQDESVVDFKFRAGPPNRNYDDAREADNAAYAAYYREMLSHGILLAPSQNEVMFLSTAHTAEDVDETLTAAEQSLPATVASYSDSLGPELERA
jgi:glutamate-1-semialdehyde 2,1-aminomutase